MRKCIGPVLIFLAISLLNPYNNTKSNQREGIL